MISPLQRRLFFSVLAMIVALSLFNITGNILGDFPMSVNLKWAVLIIVSIGSYILVKYSRYSESGMFFFFFFLIIFFFPFAYIESGGSENNGLGYVYLTLICVTYLFQSWRRWFFVALLITVFLSLHILESISPELFPVYTSEMQFIERMIQVPLILLLAALIIWRFAKDYEQATTKLQYYAHHDELTGLSNRRRFNQYIDELIHTPEQDGYLVLIDLDDFKLINDRHGHAAGDQVLKTFAEILQENFPEREHMLSRWGGDEFAIVFRESQQELQHRLNRVCAAFEKSVAAYCPQVGVSFGVTPIASNQTVSDLLLMADKNQYKMKSERKENLTDDAIKPSSFGQND